MFKRTLTWKTVVGVMVLAAWAHLMGLLIRARAPHGGTNPPQKVSPSMDLKEPIVESWYLIKWYGLPTGRSVRRVGDRTDASPGQASEVNTVLKLSVQGAPGELTMKETTVTDSQGRLVQFKHEMASKTAISDHRMWHIGEVKDGTLVVDIVSGGESKRMTFDAPKNLCLAETVGAFLAADGGLREGLQARLPVYAYFLNEVGDMEVQVVAREVLEILGSPVEAYKLKASYKGEFATLSWVTQDGRTLVEESEESMRLEMTSEKEAQSAELGLADVVALTSIPSGMEDGFFADRASVQVQLSGIDWSAMELETHGQRWLDESQGLMEIRRTEPPEKPVAFPVSDPAFAPWLKSSAYVQSDDPRIRQVAQDIVEGCQDAWEASIRLHDWVHRQIRKNPVLSMPSALDALESLEGDCYEHTTLFVALARAVGIPAEICVGLGHTAGRYCYHAWPEVYVGEWVRMDPTFGQDVADVGHLCLASGDLGKQVKLMKVLGRLEIKVLSP